MEIIFSALPLLPLRILRKETNSTNKIIFLCFSLQPQHWLRRQIGSILPEHRDHARKEWTTEEVRCITPSEVLADWSGSSRKGSLVATHTKTTGESVVTEERCAILPVCFILWSEELSLYSIMGWFIKMFHMSSPCTSVAACIICIVCSHIKYMFCAYFHSLKAKKKRRPHVLKIDVEGHDYEVLLYVIVYLLFLTAVVSEVTVHWFSNLQSTVHAS